jgi:hypothetical protein
MRTLNKTVLDYNISSGNILNPFFPVVDTLDNVNEYYKYDIVITHRDGIQSDINNILKFTHNKTKILVDVTTESGCIDSFIDYIDEISKKHSHIKFYIIADCVIDFKFTENVSKIDSYELSLLPYFDNFSIPHNQQYIIHGNSDYKKEMGFTSLNGSIRTSRILLFSEFIKRKIISFEGDTFGNDISFRFYINYSTYSFNVNSYHTQVCNLFECGIISEGERDTLINISKNLPIMINSDSYNGLSLGNYHKKILNIVTENVAGFDSDCNHYNTITFTEKAWIPLKLHQMPLYIALPGYVSKIRDLGFDVFDDMINHSYDTEQNPFIRMKMVVDELERLLKLDLIDFYDKNRSRFIRNSVHCHTLKSEGFLLLKDFIFNNILK